jgi:uncharacterized protein YjiS (DUF1127 family)
MPLQTTIDPVPIATRRPRRGDARHTMPGASLRWVEALLTRWRERMRSRRQLQNLCDLHDHILQDIGLTRAALLCETTKPFWQ